MPQILIVSGSGKGAEGVAALFSQEAPGTQYTFASSGAEARRIVLSASFDAVAVNTPLPDEFGHEFLLSLAENTLAGLLLFVKAENFEGYYNRVSEYGIAVISKPVHRQLFSQTFRLVMATRNRMLSLKRENDKLQRKLDETKLVGRAKCALIAGEKLSEPEAHRLIEKRAMDERRSRLEIAKEILSLFS